MTNQSTIDKLIEMRLTTMHIPQELRIRSGGTERHSASS